LANDEHTVRSFSCVALGVAKGFKVWAEFVASHFVFIFNDVYGLRNIALIIAVTAIDEVYAFAVITSELVFATFTLRRALGRFAFIRTTRTVFLPVTLLSKGNALTTLYAQEIIF
jgi:hypothetical protein